MLVRLNTAQPPLLPHSLCENEKKQNVNQVLTILPCRSDRVEHDLSWDCIQSIESPHKCGSRPTREQS